MADEGKGGIGAVAGSALAAGGAILGTVSHTPTPAVLIGGSAIRAESQFGSAASGFADDIVVRSADDFTVGAGASSQISEVGHGAQGFRPMGSIAGTVGQGISKTQDRQLSIAYSAVVDAARPKIVTGLLMAPRPMTRPQIADLIKADLTAAAQKQSIVRPSEIQFEAFSGKLTVTKSLYIGNAKLTFGDINIYKVAIVAAGAVLICRTLPKDKINNCVSEALDKAGGISEKWVTKEEISNKLGGGSNAHKP